MDSHILQRRGCLLTCSVIYYRCSIIPRPTLERNLFWSCTGYFYNIQMRSESYSLDYERSWMTRIFVTFRQCNSNFAAVVSATISVICELARKNPKNYLALAPQLF